MEYDKTENISELRKKLEDLIDNNVNLTDPKVIALSKKLDALIIKHQITNKTYVCRNTI